MTETHKFGINPIFSHAFNADCSQLAISCINEVHIYSFKNGKFDLQQALTEHTERVTGIDWGKKTNRIVTCSADRNAYVWTKAADSKLWKPVLVILRIERAATCVKWSPEENKFAVGSGSRLVSICNFDVEQNWWTSKQIKKGIRSTITCIDWHPNNCLIAVGSTDFKARVFSAFVKEVEKKAENNVAWGDCKAFQTLVQEWPNGSGGGWIHSIAFSPSGDKLAWIAHDSSVSVVDGSSGNLSVVLSLRHDLLPLTSFVWISEKVMLTVGHDCCPCIFLYEGGSQGGPKFQEMLQIDSSKNTNTGQVSAKKLFQNMDKNATVDNVTNLNTLHQNTITQIAIMKRTGSKVDKISTVGTDGLLAFWDLRSLEKQFAQLKL